MQLNAWVADNFMNIEILHNRMPCKYNNERNAWAADNLAPFDMPFLSIIA